MRHFMAQFGPALQWPWTKLIDVPELTDELLDRIVAQSDEQAAGRSIRELERVRDDCLVADHAGAAQRELRRRQRARALRARPVRPRAGPAAGRRRRAAAPAPRPHPPGVGRLQRPHEREPLPAAVRRRDGRPAAPRRRRRRVPGGGRQLLHGRDAPRVPARGAGRRARCWSRRSCSGTTPSACCCSTACCGRATRRSSRRPSTCCSTSTPTPRRAAPAGPEVLARVAALAERHAALERPRPPGAASPSSGAGRRRDAPAQRPARDGRPARAPRRCRRTATAVVRAPHLTAARATEGVVFERAYCASPLCAPSRAR